MCLQGCGFGINKTTSATSQQQITHDYNRTMAAQLPNLLGFSPQTVTNSFTTISNHFAGLQNKSNTPTQEFALLGNVPPVALA